MCCGRLGLQCFFPGRSSGTRFPWRKAHRALWEARLTAIRDNEHVRRIEQPVYRRRWDEQWKVSDRWMAGRVAYAQEFVDAFRWWLAEKAEWHLEHKARGGPIGPDAWTVPRERFRQTEDRQYIRAGKY